MGDIDRIAEQFIPTRGRAWRNVVDFLKRRDRGLVADLGCGNGRHSFPAAMIGYEVVALDISWKLIRHVLKRRRKLRLSTLHPVIGSITHIPIRDGVIDVALVIAVLHSIPTLKLRFRALQEVWRILKTGGKALVTVWSAFQPRHVIPLFSGLLKLLTRRLWEPFDAEVPWRAGLNYTVHRFYHLYTPCELKYTISRSAPWIYKVGRFDVKRSVFPQNYAAIMIKIC